MPVVCTVGAVYRFRVQSWRVCALRRRAIHLSTVHLTPYGTRAHRRRVDYSRQECRVEAQASTCTAARSRLHRAAVAGRATLGGGARCRIARIHPLRPPQKPPPRQLASPPLPWPPPSPPSPPQPPPSLSSRVDSWALAPGAKPGCRCPREACVCTERGRTVEMKLPSLARGCPRRAHGARARGRRASASRWRSLGGDKQGFGRLGYADT